MSDPTDSLRRYVRAALQLQGYAFSEDRIAEITLQFMRIESVARDIQPADAAAVLNSGPAGVFRP